MWQWWTSRSMRAAAITSSPRTLPHSSKPLFEVSTVDALSCRALMSWKKSTAPSWLTGRYPLPIAQPRHIAPRPEGGLPRRLTYFGRLHEEKNTIILYAPVYTALLFQSFNGSAMSSNLSSFRSNSYSYSESYEGWMNSMTRRPIIILLLSIPSFDFDSYSSRLFNHAWAIMFVVLSFMSLRSLIHVCQFGDFAICFGFLQIVCVDVS